MGNYVAVPKYKVKFNIKNIKLPQPPKLKLNWKSIYPYEESKIYEEITTKSKPLLSKLNFSSKFDPKKMVGKIDQDSVMKMLNNLMEMVKSTQEGGPSGFKPERPMKFPYTLTAKIMQFPYKFYYDNNWIAKYYCYAFIVCLPIFYKIQKMATSPSNKKNWADLQKKQAQADHEAHADH